MTTISIRLSEPGTFAAAARLATLTVFTRLSRLLQSTWCVVNGGHYKVFHTEPERLALRCVACGHTTPGWAVGSPRLARTTSSNPERLAARRGPSIV